MQPPVPSTGNAAVFLDFDGTLVDFAPTPEAVVVSPQLKHLLQSLNLALDGALALVTGRSLSSLEGLLGSTDLCAAGCHGAEWRTQRKIETVLEQDASGLEAARASLTEFAAEHGLLVEDKPYSLALHFRDSPHLEAQVDSWLNQHLKQHSGIRVIDGKFVREVQLAGVDKGVAVKRFMQQAPFAGRTPIYIGDDVTDEDAFAYVNEVDGVSVKVGTGDSLARYRLADFRAVSEWLGQLVER